MSWSLPPLKSAAREPKAFVYCRVSSKRQAEANISLPTQVQVCTDFMEKAGLSPARSMSKDGLLGIFHDPAVSAWKTPIDHRPGFRDMWSNMRRGDQIVMIALDRGWRSVADFVTCYQKFRACGVEVHFANTGGGFGGETDSPMNRFLLTNEANIAQLKSELISARMREFHRERKLKSLNAGASPEQCDAAQEHGKTSAGRKVHKIHYSGDGPDWGAAYRGLKARRDDIPTQGRVFGYCRVSTDDQSCETQRVIIDREMQKFSESRDGVTVAGMYEDHGISAYSVPWAERPFGKQLWEQLREGDHVMILAADRAFRSIKDMAVSMQQLEEKGVALHFVRDGIDTSTRGGIRLLQSLSLAAQWERDDISSRITLSLENIRKQRGDWIGPSTANWITEKIEFGHRLLLVDPKSVDRTILITNMIRNKGKTSWENLIRQIENECAERDGRRPIPAHGCSLALYRRRCTESQRSALREYILRKRHSWSMDGTVRFGVNLGRGKDELMPEISYGWARKWEKEVWGKLMNYVSVKPDIFGDCREKILAVG